MVARVFQEILVNYLIWFIWYIFKYEYHLPPSLYYRRHDFPEILFFSLLVCLDHLSDFFSRYAVDDLLPAGHPVIIAFFNILLSVLGGEPGTRCLLVNLWEVGEIAILRTLVRPLLGSSKDFVFANRGASPFHVTYFCIGVQFLFHHVDDGGAVYLDLLVFLLLWIQVQTVFVMGF